MNHWAFIAGAYVVTLAGLASVLLHSLAAMRRAEAAADRIAGGRGVGGVIGAER